MKKTSLAILALVASFNFAGCKKLIDQLHIGTAQEFKYCDIKKFKVWFNDSYNEFTVTYNNKGQPKDVIGKYADSPFHNWSVDQHFRYDKQGRLTDWITNPPKQQHVWTWSTYHYLTPTKVVDSTYGGWDFESLITDEHPYYQSKTPLLVRILDFDNSGRIIKMSLPDGTYATNFVYDVNGNSNYYSAYDSGVNVMRTNKIWMFVNFNYNANNYTLNRGGAVSLSYNAYMLPTDLTFTIPYGEQFMTAFVANKMVIEYDCNGKLTYY
jgi:hypothetical protein